MTLFAQTPNMDFFRSELNRPQATHADRLATLETLRDLEVTGIGDFYHEALRTLLSVEPNITSINERDVMDRSIIIVAQGLGQEAYLEAAADLWQAVLTFDVIRDTSQGLAMQEALSALGQIGAQEYLPHIIQRLNDFNALAQSDLETRRRHQRGVVGAINALTALGEPEGFRPVFFAANGWYDSSIRAMASTALPNIVEDPGEIIAEIIRDPSITPPIKYEAWREMLRTRAPDESKAMVASVALATSWNYMTPNVAWQTILNDMRMSAIDNIRVLGVHDESVYTNLARTYTSQATSNTPNYDMITRVINALGTVATDEAVDLLMQFLQQLHDRRQVGPWGQRERAILQTILPALGNTGSQNMDLRMLLTTIERASYYTGAEQGWARNALRALGY